MTPETLGQAKQALRVRPTLAAGFDHSLSVRTDGTVWAVGDNTSGQLGTGSTALKVSTPVQVPGLSGMTTVAAGRSSSLAVRSSDGTVWSWGLNSEGALGDGTTEYTRRTPVQVVGLKGVVAVAGSTHSLALGGDGRVWAWGDNTQGQLGQGTQNSTTPLLVPGLSDVVDIAAGDGYSLALRSDGTVWGWGSNAAKTLGPGAANPQRTPRRITGLSGVTAVAAGEYNVLALRSDGSVWSWGENFSGQLGDGTTTDRGTPAAVPGLGTAVSVAASRFAGFATLADGTVWGWGNESDIGGELPEGADPLGITRAKQTPGVSSAVSVVASPFATMVRIDGGAVWAWGDNGNGALGTGAVLTKAAHVQARGLSQISSVATGNHHALALRSTGSVWSWGFNDKGQLGDGTRRHRSVPEKIAGLGTTVSSIAAGDEHSLAVRTDGTVWAWGNNQYGQLGDGTTDSRVAPVRVLGLTSVSSIATGEDHSLAVRTDGTVWAWGTNSDGQLGDGTKESRVAPVRVQSLTNAVAVCAGKDHSLALRADGTVWAWGANDDNQLGDGTHTPRAVPGQVPGVSSITSIAGSDCQTVMRSDGSLWSWTYYGSTPTRVYQWTETGVAFATGRQHSLVLRSDNTVWSWGFNDDGQLGFYTDGGGAYDYEPNATQVPGENAVKAVSSRMNFSLVVRTDGTVWGWGSNSAGELGNGLPLYVPYPVRTLLR